VVSDNVTAMTRTARTPEPAAAPVGRPRANPRPIEGTARDEIVAAATRLFAEQGFASTTMSQIAETAGLRQSSLYYYFRRKELILEATFSVNRAPLDFLKRMRGEPGSAALQLFRLVRFDVVQLCLAPCDFNEVYRISIAQPQWFEGFWADRRELHRRTETVVRAGIDEESFIDVDSRFTALHLLSANEGSQNWWRQRGDRRLDGRGPGRPPRYSPHQMGELAAANALRALLKRPAQLPTLQRHAAAFDDTPA
jgi:TetR/AcrR family transcriptional regulator